MSVALVLASTALPFVLSPGASFTITINGAANGDRWSGLKVWTGTALGILLLAFAAAQTGLGVMVANDSLIKTIFGAVGGIVLVLFGLLTIFRELRQARASLPQSRQQPRLVLWSFLALVTNVKALSLYVLVVPTITGLALDGLSQYMSFAVVHILMLLAWLCLIALAVSIIPGVASSRVTRFFLSALAGAVMVTLGMQAIVGAFRVE